MEGIENKKQYSDLKLFEDRKKRFQKSFKKKDPIMRPILFIILNSQEMQQLSSGMNLNTTTLQEPRV